ncbi:MAG: EVE domain-containing protein [Betaproteobacteria bacterium HGW-Betaproteobacteria-7]|nr:MAG: EVE domain-containing protein [Betaproteobacteria bacterium HGW-Betaproteobacteria-7]
MHYWLMKSEPDEVSIDDLAAAPGQTVPWFGVRNYQARNFLRDTMKIGDQAFFYHSGGTDPGIAGICEIGSDPYPDATQFAAGSPYFDASSTPEKPRWLVRDVRFVARTRYLTLAELRTCPELANMRLLARGNRLSITPVSAEEWQFITGCLLELPAPKR